MHLCTINLCLLEEGCICFYLCLRTVGLVSSARPLLFCSADRFQYLYPISDRQSCRNGKGLTPFFWIKTQVRKILALKTMSKIVQMMLKQWSTQEKCHRKSLEKTKQEHPSICCCVNSLKTSAMVASAFTIYKSLRLSQILYQQKGRPSFLKYSSRDWSIEKSQEVLKNWHEALGEQVNAHDGGENCNMTII